MLTRPFARCSLLAAVVGGGCSLVVETDALQGGVTGGGEGPASSTSTASSGVPPSGSTPRSTGAAGAGGDGGAATTAATGGGGEGGAGAGGSSSTGGGGSGGGPTWCEANAPVDAFLCADFDTPTTGLSSPPWSTDVFESLDGTITLDEETFHSGPASARIALSDAQEPSCGYQALERGLPGSPGRLQTRFAFHAEDTSGTADDALVAMIDWETSADLICTLILGLAEGRGFLIEQTRDADGGTQATVGQDQFDAPVSFFEGWHDVVLSVDMPGGTVEVTDDGTAGFFVGAGAGAFPLTAACTGDPQPGTVRIRLGAHCELPPLVMHYDDVVLAPF